MTTSSSIINAAVILALVAAFVWVAVKFSSMPLVLGIAGVLLVAVLTLVWLPSARRKVKKRQKPDGLGNSELG